MLSLTAHEIPSLLLENKNSNGFYFLTLPTHQTRTYRISMEYELAGVVQSYYYDFRINTESLARNEDLWDDMNPSGLELDGALIMGIPFNRSLFRRYGEEPVQNIAPIYPDPEKTQAQVEFESIGPDTFAGETFKLLMITPYIVSVNLVEVNKDYNLTQYTMVRFVYWRLINGEIVFTGSFGDPILDSVELESLRGEITETDNIKTLILPTGKRVYIFKVTYTPNIIHTSKHSCPVNMPNDFEEYTAGDLTYRLYVPGDGYNNVSFFAYLMVYDSDGTLLDPPTQIRVVSLNQEPITVVSAAANTTTKIMTLTLKNDTLANELDFRVYKSTVASS